MSAWRFRVVALERRAGHARYAVTPAVTARAPSGPSRASEELRGSSLSTGSDTWSIMRLPPRRLPNESPDRGSCRRSPIATTPRFRRAPRAGRAFDREPSGRTRSFVPAWPDLAAGVFVSGHQRRGYGRPSARGARPSARAAPLGGNNTGSALWRPRLHRPLPATGLRRALSSTAGGGADRFPLIITVRGISRTL